MLHKKFRVRLDRDFKHIFSRGRSVYARTLGARYAPSLSTEPRFAFLVSNKISKKAVERNRLKRRLRGLVARHLPAVKTPHDVVIIAKPGSSGLSYQELEEEFISLLKRMRLL